jgi:hypothetical protein
MAHAREELALGLVGPLRRLLRFPCGLLGLLLCGDVSCGRVDEALIGNRPRIPLEPPIGAVACPIAVLEADRVRADVCQLR